MKNFKKIILSLVIIVLMVFCFAGCRPYAKPILKTISPSQTAFLVPLTGDTKNQAAFKSEEALALTKVPTKQVTVDQRWIQDGYSGLEGYYTPSQTLIIVERKPETREWTNTSDTGTTAKNEAISAESKESIGFSVGMNCSAQIDEADAVKFLYRYNNKSLADIMDTEIRARVESDFVEQCSKYSLTDLLLNKEPIMKSVRDDIATYFKDRGITINVLGMKDGIEYDSKAIQTSIDEKFSSAQAIIAQQNKNQTIISAAEAQAKANAIINGSLTDKLIEKQKIEKWNGQTPQVQGGNGSTLFSVDGTKSATK